MTKTLVYQMYPISWGNISAMIQHLERIAALEADYVWLSPLNPSPRHDGGYDLTDHFSIDSRLGTIDDFDRFVKAAHELGLGVLMDLPLGHTSTEHRWFKEHPEYYCWSDHDHPEWRNLLDDGSAWKYNDEQGAYYLHLLHEEEAVLNWFPDGSDDRINAPLLREFHRIIDFWTWKHDVDGFHLDILQIVNKDLTGDDLLLDDLPFNDYALGVIEEVFMGSDSFLVMGCIDPTAGSLVEYYANNSPVNYILDVSLKNELTYDDTNEADFLDLVRTLTKNPFFMLDLESHNSPRLPSLGVHPEDAIRWLFSTGAQGVCLYQGQELGLDNPSADELPDELMLELDPVMKKRCETGEVLLADELRLYSCANTRVPLPLDEYARQEKDPGSCLNITKNWIRYWRKTE